jgi:glucose/arabinose dehydrogenase
VASYSLGTIFRLQVLPAGLLGPAVAYATGFDSPLGVVQALDGTIFVSDSAPSTRPGRTRDGRVWALPASGGEASTVGRLVVSELPNGRHATNNLAIVGHRLYITNGNSTDDGVAGGEAEEPLSGTLLSVRLSARGLTPTTAPVGSLIVEAKGMRNPYDLAFRPGTTEAWIVTNGPDNLEPFGEDLLMRTTVSRTPPPWWPTTNFGFPGCVYKAGPTGEAAAGNNPAGFLCDPAHKKPEQLLGLHVSADGLAFGPGPEKSFWGGDLFIAEFGSFEGTQGHKIVRVPVGPRGVTGRPVDFFVGGTPLDLTFGPEGMYVADFGTGQITLFRAPAI